MKIMLLTLNVDIKIIEEVFELCSSPDINRETLH
jgi:hypothetical protein